MGEEFDETVFFSENSDVSLLVMLSKAKNRNSVGQSRVCSNAIVNIFGKLSTTAL
ncbi:MAG: hypothetical protein LBU92_07120 [Prevotellaceae bacterium]|nr:hypothetical protein [Prevotellaceae bacterium]